MSSPLQTDQLAKFHQYHSLDLQNKIYQLKTLDIISKLKLPPHPNITDLGGADGSFHQLLIKHLKGTGVSLDLTKGHNLEEKFPLKDNSVDLIIAHEIIEHLFDTDHFVKEIRRILKPGGFVIISTPNLASLKNRFRLLLGLYPQYLEYSKQGAGHIHLYTAPVLITQLASHKLIPQILTSPNFPCPFITKPQFPELLKKFFYFLGDLLPQYGSHLIVLATKK